jgi:hypothetical protein
MKIKSGIISAVAGLSLLGGAGVAVLAGGGGAATPATLLSAPVSVATPAPAPVAVTPAPAPAPAVCLTSVDDGNWPLFADGRPPKLDAGDAAADYLWHDSTGWHLRVTHQNDHHQVWSGVLTTTGTFSDVSPVKLEQNDSLTVGPDKHTIAFKFNNYGGIDGLDFRTQCAPSIHFNLRADGALVNPTEVIIGHGDYSPPKVPFAVRRQA